MDVKMEGSFRKDAFWLGEAQSRVVVSVAPEKEESFMRSVIKTGTGCLFLGTVTSGRIRVEGEDWGHTADWKELYDTAIEKQLAGDLVSEGALGMI
jgi:phosphoribosylformylglycinamidine synthase